MIHTVINNAIAQIDEWNYWCAFNGTNVSSEWFEG